jgi:hypothetical protein
MAKRGQLCRDRAKATALASLGRLAGQTASLDHDCLGDGLSAFTPARSRTLAVPCAPVGVAACPLLLTRDQHRAVRVR